MNTLQIPELDPLMLSDTIPSAIFAGGSCTDPRNTLFLWRSCATEKARGGTLTFFLDDERLEPLWSRPERYSKQFLSCGIGVLVEVDFSLWADRPLEEQRFNVFRQRSLARQWQEAGLFVAPCLNWSNERSFSFCFAGVPTGCHVAFVEARTAGQCDADRQAFFYGLHMAVQQVKPKCLVVYGGLIHEWWIRRNLPACSTEFVLLESWTDARRRVRAEQEKQELAKVQPELFVNGGTDKWAEEAQVAVA